MGIKSFQGRRAAPVKLESAPILVEDYMTSSLITFKKEQSVAEVMEAMIKNKISGAPVVNDFGELEGVISDGDCMKQISESRYFNMPIGDMKIENYMDDTVAVIDKNLNIFDCAQLFYKHDCRRFPVIEYGKLIGMISRKDILCAALKLRGQNWHC
ncbi:CBS domain-containing protein [Zunongwangia sp. SCSIO 43204]|uniref:CBS domain-containing protein n=1 Tax=Zunongwangia sp. SCSIO 43204 TaxID=2779359 RepID=UPI001CA80D1D|nr:CBS domain-containing protein [Zunongwangia sp. SCSIO 43204]UAB85447.1 CBS domain-containing protein [Zunongwangia sp. SCSIO 43204]